MFFLWSRYVADIPYIYHHLPHHCHYSEPGLPQVITLVLLVSSSLLQDWWAYLKIGHSQFQRTIICLSFYSYHNHKNLLKCNLGGVHRFTPCLYKTRVPEAARSQVFVRAAVLQNDCRSPPSQQQRIQRKQSTREEMG